ncbi:hypothetical protein HU200_059710 [Digitaria exilis]|uniref:Uncharacterized protein n=1 Tax=Digitaria exilis TaxID=1010633 RepID=A0A835AC27_9POAL|nr:hypothetical protein HU200_059710 [Digitaria exilis]CAB3459438.1 unnamed protein product [Digitaria exilis]
MPSAPAVVPTESPKLSPTSQQGLRRPLTNGSAAGDFELRHWRTPKKRAAAPSPPPLIDIPNGGAGSDDESNSSGGGGGGGHGYTSLRDILSSPEYAATAGGGSPAACGITIGGGCGSCGDIHMIRHPLVKHAAYAYLQMTPSAREDPGRRGRRWRGPLCRLLLGCLSFIGALFRP